VAFPLHFRGCLPSFPWTLGTGDSLPGVGSAGGTCGAQDGRNLGTQGHLCPGNGIDQQGAGGTHSSCFGMEQIDLAPVVLTQIHWVTQTGNSILSEKLTCLSSQSLASFIIGDSHLRRGTGDGVEQYITHHLTIGWG